MIDLHAHVLPGVDDGPPDIEASVALLAAAAATGTQTILATPHLDHVWDLDPRVIEPAAARVREAMRRAGVEIELLTGAEISLTRFVDMHEEELELVRLGSGPYLLVESPHGQDSGALDSVLIGLRERGHQLLLAHPERCASFQKRPESLEAVVSAGVLCQVTASSLAGDYGRRVRDFSLELLCAGLVHAIASDAHGATSRPPGLGRGLEAAAAALDGFEPLAGWLTQDVPAAILAGAKELPERPAPLPELRRRGLFGR